MAFHHRLSLGNFGNRSSMLLHLLLLDEVECEGCLDKDVNLVLRLEARCHLLVDNFFGNGRWRGVRVIEEELLKGSHCELHSVFIVNVVDGAVVLGPLIFVIVIVVLDLIVVFVLRFGLFRGLLFLVLFLNRGRDIQAKQMVSCRRFLKNLPN